MSEESDYISVDKDDDTIEEKPSKIKNRKKSKSKKDKKDLPCRFQAEGVNFKAKIIGIEAVPEARGDRMCQDALLKAKISAKSAGAHKQRICINVSLDGLKILDDKKNPNILHHHSVHRISFISRDVGDNRAFGYVYGCGDGIYQFFAIKTEKPSEGLVWTLRDLFQVVFEKKKEEAEKMKEKHKKEFKDSALYQPSVVNLIEENEKNGDDSPGPVERRREDSDIEIKSHNSEPAVDNLLDLHSELDFLKKNIIQISTLTKSCDDLENWAVPSEINESSANIQFPVTFDSPESTDEKKTFDPKDGGNRYNAFKSATSGTKSMDDLNYSFDGDSFASIPSSTGVCKRNVAQFDGSVFESSCLSTKHFCNDVFNDSFTSDTSFKQIEDPFKTDPFFNTNLSFDESSNEKNFNNLNFSNKNYSHSPLPSSRVSGKLEVLNSSFDEMTHSQNQSSPYLKKTPENSFDYVCTNEQSAHDNSFESPNIAHKFAFDSNEGISNYFFSDDPFKNDPFEQAPFTMAQHNKHKDKIGINLNSSCILKNISCVSQEVVNEEIINSSVESLEEFNMPSPIVPPPPLPSTLINSSNDQEVVYVKSPGPRHKFSRSYTIETGNLVVNLPPAIPPRNSNRPSLISQTSISCSTPPPTPPRPDKHSTKNSSQSSVVNNDEVFSSSDTDLINSKLNKSLKEKSISPISIPRPRARNHSVSPGLKVSPMSKYSPNNNQDYNLFLRDTISRSSDKCDDQIAARRVSSNKPITHRKNSEPDTNNILINSIDLRKNQPNRISPGLVNQGDTFVSCSSFNSNCEDPFKDDPFTSLNDTMQKSVNDFSADFPMEPVEFSTKAVTLDDNVFVDNDPFKDDPFFQKNPKAEEMFNVANVSNIKIIKNCSPSPNQSFIDNESEKNFIKNNVSVFETNFDLDSGNSVEKNYLPEEKYRQITSVGNTNSKLPLNDTLFNGFKNMEIQTTPSSDGLIPARPAALNNHYRKNKSREIKSDSITPSFINPFSTFSSELQSPDPFDTRFAKSVCDQAELHIDSVNSNPDKGEETGNIYSHSDRSDILSHSHERNELPNPFSYAMKYDHMSNFDNLSQSDEDKNCFTYINSSSNTLDDSIGPYHHLTSSNFYHSSPAPSSHLWDKRHEHLSSLNHDEIHIRNSYGSSDC